MKIYFVCFFVLNVLGCRRDQPNPPASASTFDSFIGRYLVCDSIRTAQNGTSVLTVVGKGKGGDIVYSSNGTYQVYQSPPVIKNYKYQSPDIIYYWSPGGTMSSTLYTKILSVNGNHITSTDTDNNPTKQVTYYYTAE